MYARIPAPECLCDNKSNQSDSSDHNDGNANDGSRRNATPSQSSDIVASADKKHDAVSSPGLSAPKNVPKHLWEKFQKLEKRTEEVTRRTTQRRIQHIQNDIMNKVHEEISNPDDLDILRAHDVKFGPPNEKFNKRKRKKRPTSNTSDTKQTDVRTESAHEAEFCEINNYMGINDHLKGLDHGRHAPQTEVEEKITEAISKGDFTTAEELSDHLSTREFGKRVCEAIDARAYVMQKKEEDESAKAKRKKKLPWGCERSTPCHLARASSRHKESFRHQFAEIAY
ncbi:protein FAM204A-like isoform X2 [Gigantopelta aegis]|uniref:protein FAM204A-like isoform X2 n=1 Tax=Gigantopelta aegis TaxID=1735272 RepID=UPI001B88A611|nr:protein FAM204A-like isoform X2 [Gigantopelta aegis]